VKRAPRVVTAFLLPALVVGLFALAASLLTGCAGTLSEAVSITNVIGAPVVAAGTKANQDAVAADKACLWTAPGTEVPLPLDAQAACLAHTRAMYRPVLKAYDDFLALWPAWAALVHFAEAQDVLGRKVDLTRIVAWLPDILRVTDAFTAAYSTLVSPPLPSLPTPAQPAAKVP
jgi:ABC-type branched-subunit amino acid transport system permease subunit